MIPYRLDILRFIIKLAIPSHEKENGGAVIEVVVSLHNFMIKAYVGNAQLDEIESKVSRKLVQFTSATRSG